MHQVIYISSHNLYSKEKLLAYINNCVECLSKKYKNSSEVSSPQIEPKPPDKDENDAAHIEDWNDIAIKQKYFYMYVMCLSSF